MEAAWISLSVAKPDEGQIVETKIDDEQGERNVQLLIFRKPLWCLRDGSMYVYYTPTHWRVVSSVGIYFNLMEHENTK